MFKKAKGYWNRVYLKMDKGMKQRAFRKWIEKGQKKVELQMMQMQTEETGGVDVLNHEIGELAAKEREQVVESSITTQKVKK